MIRWTHDGVVFYQFAALSKYPEIVHAVFTRLGGKSASPFHSLNVGRLVGDEGRNVEDNHVLILRTLGLNPGQVVTAHQVHGAQVAMVQSADGGGVVPSTDALMTNSPGMALLLRFADCLPLLLYDPWHKAIALAHAGWRGCLAGVVAKTVARMGQDYHSDPSELTACLGPAIGPCCYQIGPDVIGLVKEVFPGENHLLLTQPDGSLHLDLPAAVRRQLQQAGVQQIEDSSVCTCCHTDEFFSHRASGGRTGRFAAVLGLSESNSPA
jgi:YfiH family protein